MRVESLGVHSSETEAINRLSECKQFRSGFSPILDLKNAVFCPFQASDLFDQDTTNQTRIYFTDSHLNHSLFDQ